MKISRILRLLFFALVVTAMAWVLRLRAVEQLPIDYDEDDYLGAAQRYAAAINDGDLQRIIDYEFNYEHPPLTKLVNGWVISWLPPAPLIEEKDPTARPAESLPEPHFRNARQTSAVFGTLEVLALSLVNPLSGLLLAIHTWQIKYTSQIMLEPFPALTSLLVILFYIRARKNGLTENRPATRAYFWMTFSAFALGITAASKYTYAIVGIVILVDLGLDFRDQSGVRKGFDVRRLLLMVISWGLLSILVFWAFNPRLWSDPLGRLSQSIFYHGGYAQSDWVRQTGFPAWKQLSWLAGPVPWHEGVFLIALDLYILIFAIIGFKELWQRQRIFALWLLIGGGFLLIWPTKWPQYLLTITAPLCMSSAEGLRASVSKLREKISRTNLRKSVASVQSAFHVSRLRDLHKAWLWLLPGAITLALIAFYPMMYQAAMALTDFNTMSIRDGIEGGVWREVWLGFSRQVEPVDVNLWEFFDRFRRPTATNVQYAGIRMLVSLFAGALPDLLVFNILWVVLSVSLQAALGIAVAVLLDKDGLRFRGFWRTIFILPWAIPEFVGALIWLRLLEPERGWLAVMENSPFQELLAGFLNNPNTTLILLLIAATWFGFPFIMLAVTAGLKMIPSEVYEAAAIDGAGRLGRFRYVTWPLLWPLVMPAILIRSIFAFNQFYLFYTIRSFPNITFATLSYFAFSPTFGGQFAISAAINVFTVVVLIVFILLFNRYSRAAEGVTYA